MLPEDLLLRKVLFLKVCELLEKTPSLLGKVTTDTFSVNSVQAVNSVVLLPSLMAFLDALASLGSLLETQSVT